jgi:hypothetical protein
MRDLQLVAAHLLRAGLWAGTSLVAAAVARQLVGGDVGRWAPLVASAGIAVIVATPFVTLLAMAVMARRSVLGRYAAATLVFALAGILLAS